MTDIHQIFLSTTNPRGYDYGFLAKEYKYKNFMMNLRKPFFNQIYIDIKKNVYDIPMLDKIIQSGQLDGVGCLTIEGMKKLRFCYDDSGIQVLN